jgi:hypothetical protein
MKLKLTPTRKMRLAATASLVSVSFLVYMLSPSAPVGPPYRDESLTAGMEPFQLIRQRSVREELKLTEDQVQKIQAVLDKQSFRGPPRGEQSTAPAPRAARMGRKHQEDVLKGLLRPEQIVRLRQIILQRQGGLALNNAETAEQLGLTESQRQQADTILDRLTQQLAELRQARNREGPKKVEEARKAAGDEMLALLTSDQQDRWKELTGEPFTGEITFGPFGGRGGPPRGGPGGPPGGGPGGGAPPGPGGPPGGGPPGGGDPPPPGGND